VDTRRIHTSRTHNSRQTSAAGGRDSWRIRGRTRRRPSASRAARRARIPGM
jgi:hypothetical protein